MSCQFFLGTYQYLPIALSVMVMLRNFLQITDQFPFRLAASFTMDMLLKLRQLADQCSAPVITHLSVTVKHTFTKATGWIPQCILTGLIVDMSHSSTVRHINLRTVTRIRVCMDLLPANRLV